MNPFHEFAQAAIAVAALSVSFSAVMIHCYLRELVEEIRRLRDKL